MSQPARSFVFGSLRLLVLVMLVTATGCAGRAWQQTVSEDTPAGYYRFLREHGDTSYAERAQERLAFHKLKRNPTLDGFERFRKQYPSSALLAELHPVLEEPAFQAARAEGTAASYRAFLEKFPQGRFAARALGNAVYVEAAGFGGEVAALAAFNRNHPDSDFAAEAQRTVEATAARQGRRIDRMGVVIELAPGTPEARRVREAFQKRIREITERAGIATVPLASADDASASAPTARLVVSHAEKSVDSSVEAGQMARSARVGTTRVVLRESARGAIIAERSFDVRVEDKAHVPDTSLLFSAASPAYWKEFFVPTARWRNDQAIRPPIPLGAPVVDVDAVGDRAVVLYENGAFDVLGLADPLAPVTLASYRRGEKLKRWTGVRVLGERVAIYGEEGLELVRFTEAGAQVEGSWGRGEIGRVLSIAPLGQQLVVVGAKGMQLLDPATATFRRVLRRVVLGVAAAGDTLVFVDGESIFVSDLGRLGENRVIAQLKLGKTFGPNNVRILEDTAIVTGPGGALVIDMTDPTAPKALSKVASLQVGEIFDATRVRGRTFLVGERGALLLGRDLRRVEETLDVGPRQRVAVMGRHFVVASKDGVQVVDAAPWAQHTMPAATRP